MNLRQRIEHRAGRLAHELERTANVERAVQRLFGRVRFPSRTQIWPSDASATPNPCGVAGMLLQLDAALRQRERLLVAVLHQCDVGLVAAHGGQHVAGVARAAPAAPPARSAVIASSSRPLLGQRDSRQRVHHREVARVSGGVKGGSGLREVVAHDGGVADLAIAEPELVVGEADGAGIVGPLGLRQRPRQKSNAAGGLAAGGRQPAMHAPEIGQAGGVQSLARLGRAAERLGSLAHVVLQQPGLRQGAADPQLVPRPETDVSAVSRGAEAAVAPCTALERRLRLSRKDRRGHGREYTSYTAGPHLQRYGQPVGRGSDGVWRTVEAKRYPRAL